MKSVWGRRRSLIAFWLLGLCNNYGYVVMLSAAHDIIKSYEHGTTGHKLDNSTTNVRDCNQMSTSVILLMDIIPALVIKVISPFLPLFVNVRMTAVIAFSLLGFLITALARTVWISFLGIACTSLASGLGETTLLSYSVFFDSRSVIAAWSSGTGAAGFFGSMTYATLIAIGLTPTTTLFSLTAIPVIMAISFWFLLSHPDMEQKSSSVDVSGVQQSICVESFFTRLKYVPSVLRYLIPMMLVYFLEYFINQGLYELVYLRGISQTHSEQYRWYQVLYQVGVFISRSIGGIFMVEQLWIMVILQGINVVYFLFDSIYSISPSIYIVFALCIWEGLVGGMSYVSVFQKIKKEVKLEYQEVTVGMTTLGDSLGVSAAGFVAIPVHNRICSLPL